MDELLGGLAEYHNDVETALRFYFSESSPAFSVRFVGLRRDEAIAARDELLANRLERTDEASSFFMLTRVEAAFRIDYECRCKQKMKDSLSRVFREMYKSRKEKVRLDEDIFEAWREHSTGSRRLIAELRGAFKFRHWLAHGSYWMPKFKKYDFDSVYSLADETLHAFPLRNFE